ncbi:MAG: hypothetical protein WC071_13615 [Victivallaceae bacterium]
MGYGFLLVAPGLALNRRKDNAVRRTDFLLFSLSTCQLLRVRDGRGYTGNGFDGAKPKPQKSFIIFMPFTVKFFFFVFFVRFVAKNVFCGFALKSILP